MSCPHSPHGPCSICQSGSSAHVRTFIGQQDINGLLPQVPSPSSELHGTQATTSFYQEQIRTLQTELREIRTQNKALELRVREAEAGESELLHELRALKRAHRKLQKEAAK